MDLPIPLIDLSLHPETAAKLLREACTEHGFFFVCNHGVPQEVSEAQFRISRTYFALSEEVKLQSEAIGNRGYTRLGEQTLDPKKQNRGDTKESYYICKPEAPEGSEKSKLPFHGPNRWPEALPSFRIVMEQYMHHMEALHKKMVQLITLALGLPVGYFDSTFVDPLLTLRPIHYTAELSDAASGVYGAGAHTDWGFMTFVDVDSPGLQIFFKGDWHSVPQLPGAFVVNIGDLLERWTNGVFRSTLHRVVNSTPGKERYSCAYFVSPAYNAKIECLPTCIGDGPKYEATVCAEYLTMKYSQTHSNYNKLAEAA